MPKATQRGYSNAQGSPYLYHPPYTVAVLQMLNWQPVGLDFCLACQLFKKIF